MGKKMRRLICALLASAMVVSSVGMVAFADEETTNDITTEATEAPAEATEAPADATEAPAEATEAPAEATEAPVEATEAPATDEGAYSEDAYYQKALSLCTALGIISGYEDGSVRPESNVTRAEMAKIILTMLNITSMSKYQNNFSDVSESHWAADIIQTAQEAGIINGMGDGTFAPDGNVTYAQIATMIVRAMNYTMDAEYNGGWPNGYMKVANTADLNLFKNAPGSNDVASDRGVVIKMVYNALLGMYKEITGYENNSPVYTANRTLAEAKFNLIEEKGVLLGTTKTSISSTELDENQVEIEYEVEDSDEKEAKVFDCSLTGLEEYLAQKITFYYKENAGLTPEVLAVAYDSSKTTTDTFDAEDIEKVEGFDGDAGSIKVDGTSKVKNCTGATIVYNGKVLSDADKTAIGADLNDMLLPEVGTVKIVDSDKDDVYDVVFVDSYEVMVVSSASEDRLTGKVSAATDNDTVTATKAVTINLDDSIDRVVTVTKEDTEIKVRNLKKNDVATIKRSYDNSVVDIVVTGESVTGKVSGLSVKYDNSYATIGGEKYDVANIATGDISTGVDGTYYFDMFGRIAYVDSSSVLGRLGSDEQYGWLMDVYESDDGKTLVNIMTQDGKAVEYTFASSVDYWAPKSLTGSVTMSQDEMEKEINELNEDANKDKFEYLWKSTRYTSGYDQDGERPLAWEKDYPIRLLKFKANSSNKISRIYFAVNTVNKAKKYYQEFYDPSYGAIKDGKTITDHYLTDSEISSLIDSDALIIDSTNRSGSTLVGGLLGGYQVTDKMVEFGVPDDASNFADADKYDVGNVNAAEYNLRENGLSDTYFFADMDGVSPAAVVRLISDTTKPVNPADMDNVGGSPAMVVDEISMAVDEDDEIIYTITGYTNGSETSITTSTSSALAELTGYNDKVYATGEVLWTGQSDVSIANYLHKGDIIISDGKHILLYACVEDVYNTLKEDLGNDASKYVQGSETRNYFYFDKLSDYAMDDVSWVMIGSRKVSIDDSLLMDTVEIDLSRDFENAVTIDTEGSTIADLSAYDPQYGGDMVFARFANKGSLQEMMVYRIKK